MFDIMLPLGESQKDMSMIKRSVWWSAFRDQAHGSSHADLGGVFFFFVFLSVDMYHKIYTL